MEPLLEIIDLEVHYPTRRGPIRAVDGVSLTLHAGERLGLIGESGSGKSTIALAVMRMIKTPGQIVEGQILLEGVDLLSLSEEEIRQRRLADIAMVTQGAMNSLNPVIRVRSQMVDGLKAHGIELSKDAYDERIGELLTAVGLDPNVADLYPHELSGGMKQRVCIATAISLSPKVIIADEPTSALDVVVQRQVMMTLRKVQERLDAAVILIGHDMGLMAQFAQRVAVMRHGKILEVAEVHEIFANPQDPYTRELMESLPTFERTTRFMEVIEEAAEEVAAVAAAQ
ncbi:MAG: ABC transporter ATP-binding protein [Thermomicrobiales bacterium]